MNRNIVICSDGTGNSFERQRSNVARLVPLLALNDHREQLVVYDQGIGTDARRWHEVESFRASIRDQQALVVLPGPHESRFPPAEWAALGLGLAFGFGLAENVKQMYQQLTSLYEEGDRVFLFGFSRGAFTVRALAGLLYRCGLPPSDRSADDWLFRQAWTLYQPMHPDEDAVAAFRAREEQRDCSIYFLGLWDTVKSYGGLRPVMLPHLRHNPIVDCVRHAVALDEQRGWFDVTTWGRLDIDVECNAAWSRIPEPVKARIRKQSIEEVWFRGCHSDVGGGNGDEATERIALQWMLAEAHAKGIALSEAGCALLDPATSDKCATVHDSHNRAWRAVEIVPRRAIDNSGTWPRRVWAKTPNAKRDPLKLARDGKVAVHRSVGFVDGIPPECVVRHPPDQGHPVKGSQPLRGSVL
jgi:uncharacterized protein (DUF2235 family)